MLSTKGYDQGTKTKEIEKMLRPQPIIDVARSLCYIHLAYGCKLSLLMKACREELFPEWCEDYHDGVWSCIQELCSITYEQTFYEDEVNYECIRDYIKLRNTAYRDSEAWTDIRDQDQLPPCDLNHSHIAEQRFK